MIIIILIITRIIIHKIFNKKKSTKYFIKKNIQHFYLISFDFSQFYKIKSGNRADEVSVRLIYF